MCERTRSYASVPVHEAVVRSVVLGVEGAMRRKALGRHCLTTTRTTVLLFRHKALTFVRDKLACAISIE